MQTTAHTQTRTRPHTATFITLHILLGLLMAGGIICGILLTVAADDARATMPEAAHLYWPLLLIGELIVVCGEVFLLSLWLLVLRVQRSRIFDPRSFGIVNVLAASAFIAAALSLTATFTVSGTSILGGYTTGLAVVLLALGLTIRVMKYLLVQASENQRELAGVI
ncbi:DUF2975 domain-containing protein [Corynebacterium aquilae]|uniref:DUF2975 domain-containing protein n=1 Tax=Corynebacterium aquilae DSM 44791 TaxID=1431546 RepID=A0A1L7CF91_9CORY|nr:DUF2975 domain-containing protein [Corynebacterium aquilae]APT84443.1 hypothetical protein CAQU_04465 [Corynebacterium aquilae DSM 44791]